MVKGVYSDMKFIKTRQTVQVVFEFPIEATDAIYREFGYPNPAESKWAEITAIVDQG